jgi:UDPglucose 6-dehydrogenase
MEKKSIAIFGLGYVGMSLSTLFGTKHNVRVFDLDSKKISAVQKNKSTIKDLDIQSYLDKKLTKISAVKTPEELLAGADYSIICTPTNFDRSTQYFDTSSVDACIAQSLALNPQCIVIVKSTIPVGYVDKMNKKFKTNQIVFCPEFLQEGTALRDNLNPERIVIGCDKVFFEELRDLFLGVCKNKRVPVMQVGSTEAECAKLFANSYLAMRVGFFNELDSFALERGLDSSNIINAISSDARIGNFYNNPSFGFGGYCLPKDVNQLQSEIETKTQIKSPIISSISASNLNRKNFIIQYLLAKNIQTFGIYKLSMKQGSNNFRESSILSVMNELSQSNKKIIIYEPLIETDTYQSFEVVNDLREFLSISELIIANRMEDQLEGNSKVFSRDIFGTN